MSAVRPLVDDRARAALDAIDVPITVTLAVRDRDARLLDFRLEGVNLAAAAWAGLDRGRILGRLATDLMPGLRTEGLFDELERVVSTGRPFRQTGYFDGNVEAGRRFAGTYDLMAIRHGDGYLGAWAQQREGRAPAADVEAAIERARAAVSLVRIGVSASMLVLRPAT